MRTAQFIQRHIARHRLGLTLLTVLAAMVLPVAAPAAPTSPPLRDNQRVSYWNDKVEDVPWSIQIARISRTNADYELVTLPGKSTRQGLGTMSEQIRSLPAAWGRPVAAINGDFWNDASKYAGDPSGLQISNGELLSAPGDRACFWTDTNGQPHLGAITSLLRVIWPGGESTLLGLNCERTNDGGVLFTSAIGDTTRTGKGRELILERDGANPWLPLRIGETLTARVREVREAGNAAVTPDTLVLSLSPQLAERVASVAAGTVLKLSTGTLPDLSGVKTAIGGGPVLVRGGKATQFTGHQPRHPRSAIGWNSNHLFLVQVDGRQNGLSVGMSFPELADYLVKLGCEEAMNLDGGGSSTFWIFGNVVNSPCYGHERPMANSLILVYKGKTARAEPDPD